MQKYFANALRAQGDTIAHQRKPPATPLSGFPLDYQGALCKFQKHNLMNSTKVSCDPVSVGYY
jgi:hypothetical protein